MEPPPTMPSTATSSATSTSSANHDESVAINPSIFFENPCFCHAYVLVQFSPWPFQPLPSIKQLQALWRAL
ncbi:hypothetical protein NL676_011830 [Syzygium grande]|nr:hypothetical protein NL676_011830 [Syzygium grande]